MEKQIVEFINRRFPVGCEWMNANGFYFAQILKARFHGDIVYDPVDKHFLLWASDGNFYDWSGKRSYSKERKAKLSLWSEYARKDVLQYETIWRNCIK